MGSIDIHAHHTRQCFWRATEASGDRHTPHVSKMPAADTMLWLGANADNCRRARVGLPHNELRE
jgi:hypothetical protein